MATADVAGFHGRSKHAIRITMILALLLSLLKSRTFTQAATLDKRYIAVLRTMSTDGTQRSLAEDRSLSPRQAIPSCGDAAGNPVDVQDLVEIGVLAGLPKASDAGVVFMEAVITAEEACGPYACFVSFDASGNTWANMNTLQNIPSASEGCGADAGEGKYTLVASFPPETNCTGPSGACLIMCKAQAMPLGNCAAVAWQGKSSTSTTSNMSLSSISSSVTTVSQLRTTTETATALPDKKIVASSTSLSTSSSSLPVKAAPTLRGFSGDNGPGGPSEQHLAFDLSVASDASTNTTKSDSSSTSRRRELKLIGALLFSACTAMSLL